MQHLKSLIPERFRGWILPAFCLLLIGTAVAVTLFDVSVSRLLLWAIVLACPLSHFLLGHGGHGHTAEGEHHVTTIAALDDQPEADLQARY